MRQAIRNIQQKINFLKKESKKAHDFFQFAPCILEKKVTQIERNYRITLPEDYRDFLIYIGNGGKGAYFSRLLSLQESIMMIQREELDYSFLCQPFDKAPEKVKDNPHFYCNTPYLLPGSLPISEQGCGWMDMLIISGEQRGKMWVTGDWWSPTIDEQGNQIDFLGWYQSWLDDEISK